MSSDQATHDDTFKAVAGEEFYTEPGHATLRKLVHDEPEWAVSRLVAERAENLKLAAAVEERDRLLLMAHADAWTDDANFCLTVDEWKVYLASRWAGRDHKEAPDGK